MSNRAGKYFRDKSSNFRGMLTKLFTLLRSGQMMFVLDGLKLWIPGRLCLLKGLKVTFNYTAAEKLR